jgi:hypothetical protein
VGDFGEKIYTTFIELKNLLQLWEISFFLSFFINGFKKVCSSSYLKIPH